MLTWLLAPIETLPFYLSCVSYWPTSNLTLLSLLCQFRIIAEGLLGIVLTERKEEKLYYTIVYTGLQNSIIKNFREFPSIFVVFYPDFSTKRKTTPSQRAAFVFLPI